MGLFSATGAKAAFNGPAMSALTTGAAVLVAEGVGVGVGVGSAGADVAVSAGISGSTT